MKTSTYDPKGAVEDAFWTERLQLLTAQFPIYYTKPQKVWGKFHTSDEDYFGAASEIVPLKHKKGKCTYIMMQPYVPEPILTLTVGLYNTPKHYADQDSAIGETIGQPKQQGFREVQVGNAQAWYYPADHTIVLWECYLYDFTRDVPLLQDKNMVNLWTGFEQWLLNRIPDTERIVTPFADPIWNTKEYQAFLRARGYTKGQSGTFTKLLK